MKTKETLRIASCLFLCASVHAGAALFQNLDFEAVRTPLIPNDPLGYDRVPAADAFPGWIPYIGSYPQALVLENFGFLSSAGVAIVGPGEWRDGVRQRNVIAGNYTAFLQSGIDFLNGPDLQEVSSSLSQSAMVPFDAVSLRLGIDAHGPFSVTLGSQPLSLVPLGTFTNYTLYDADVSAAAGQTLDLRITSVLGRAPDGLYSYLFVDSMEFVAVPEPSAAALLVTGGIVFVCGWRTVHRRR